MLIDADEQVEVLVWWVTYLPLRDIRWTLMELFLASTAAFEMSSMA